MFYLNEMGVSTLPLNLTLGKLLLQTTKICSWNHNPVYKRTGQYQNQSSIVLDPSHRNVQCRHSGAFLKHMQWSVDMRSVCLVIHLGTTTYSEQPFI